ncbi:MAG: hypothetical protein ACR2J7_00890 [Luteimonas sp.]
MPGHDFATIPRRVRGSAATDGAGVKLTRVMQAFVDFQEGRF